MAVSMDIVKAHATTQLDIVEDNLDNAIISALKKTPLHNPLRIDSTDIPWSTLCVLWPRYRSAGWTNAEKDGNSKDYKLSHSVNFHDLKRTSSNEKKLPDLAEELRSIKV